MVTHEQGGTLLGEVRESVAARGCRACSQDFGCWMERAGKAWVRSGKQPILRLTGTKAKIFAMAANNFHYIEIRTHDPTPSPNLSLLSHLYPSG